MLPNLREFLEPAAMERLTLLLNHVLGREEAAMSRLRAHVGATLQVTPERWPFWLPAPPAASFRITPAGLLEWCGPRPEQPPNLRVVIETSNPATFGFSLLSGRVPNAHVEGDTVLAADIDWLIANVRWDLMDDLQAAFGPAVAQLLQSVGLAVRGALDVAKHTSSDIASRIRRRAP
jgi:ubiquinone biosynthesis protein UbiJ